MGSPYRLTPLPRRSPAEKPARPRAKAVPALPDTQPPADGLPAWSAAPMGDAEYGEQPFAGIEWEAA